MSIEEIQLLCKELPAVTEDIKWENHLCYSVGEKMFIILGLDETPVTASFKVAEEDFEELSNREGFKPAPYLARYKWVFINDINLVNKKDWETFISQSYNLVKNKLPAKKRKALGV